VPELNVKTTASSRTRPRRPVTMAISPSPRKRRPSSIASTAPARRCSIRAGGVALPPSTSVAAVRVVETTVAGTTGNASTTSATRALAVSWSSFGACTDIHMLDRRASTLLDG
jgi:hypothetical protein